MGQIIYGGLIWRMVANNSFLSYQQDEKQACWEGQYVFQFSEATLIQSMG